MMKNSDVENNLTVIAPKIVEVIDQISGNILPAEEVIGSDYDRVIKLRSELLTLIKRNEPRYVCPLCHTPVYLVCRHKARHFFFRHKIDDGRCPIDTRHNMSEAEINARKYNGVKESYSHKQMKEIVVDSLKSDEKFKDIAIERVWKSQELGEWKKPDIAATFDEKTRIVFEIQLSTTFLRVIVERKEFYLKEGGLLCWIFKEIKEEYPRLMQDDIFYNNNCNIFIADEETLQVSSEQKQFFLKCCWIEPVIENKQIVNTEWKNKIVPFDQLT
jgi:competence CoiA-like predicted nuclease